MDWSRENIQDFHGMAGVVGSNLTDALFKKSLSFISLFPISAGVYCILSGQAAIGRSGERGTFFSNMKSSKRKVHVVHEI